MLKLTSAESAMPDEMPARIDEVTTTLKQIDASSWSAYGSYTIGEIKDIPTIDFLR